MLAKELNSFGDSHFQYLTDVLAVESHVKDFALEALPMTRLRR